MRAVPTGTVWSVCASSTRSYPTLMRYEEEETVSISWLEHFVSNCAFFLCLVQLLSKPKFSSVEKIKTIGSTYMAAAGLTHSPLGDEQKVCLVSFCSHHLQIFTNFFLDFARPSLRCKSKCFHPFLKAKVCQIL